MLIQHTVLHKNIPTNERGMYAGEREYFAKETIAIRADTFPDSDWPGFWDLKSVLTDR